ncbi:sterol esterase [Niveomyces insectorum RCEF 264]|uniref:Carboxylic ester hydrolase n=1 Tax=Niveomyces insectorum RCEF 264 TaxID=1081102 RepID=A0A167NGE5_9HYPO|nr:sterol esterase [Niveomyces insectorum RCEF 264]
MQISLAVVLAAGLAGLAPAHPVHQEDIPEKRGVNVRIDYPEGKVIGVSLAGIDSFRGVPFAQPPVGDLRLRPPQRYGTSVGTRDATGLGPSCPQMYFSVGNGSPLTEFLGDLIDIPLSQTATNTQEDCLTLNIQRPAGSTKDSKLPVVFWIYGGGFELGTNAMYDASGLIALGVSIHQPFLFVGVNYRSGGFGFLGGKEILADGAANLGLLDQRAGLEWVADNIAAFGGDPDRVTLWGESAGAISVFDQMALYDGNNTYKGKPLFRAGIMDSGSIVPADTVDCPKAQTIYDDVVVAAHCAGATDTLSCLRALPYDQFLTAVNSVPGLLSYTSVALSYLPRPDGAVLTDSPEKLLRGGRYAAVPMIIGDQEDEGTIFALFQSNVTSTDDLVAYLGSFFFRNATKTQLRAFVDTYPADASAGSPFRTGLFNELYPGFKRMAAILGDLVFTLSRRMFLSAAAGAHPSVPSWSYLSSYDYGTPVLGTFHGSDLLQVFYGLLPNYASKAIQTYYINFVANLDPNTGASAGTKWPQWSQNQTLLNFFGDHSTVLPDDFRAESYGFIVDNVASFRI